MSTVTIRMLVAGVVVDEVAVPLGVGTRDLIGVLGASHGAIAQQAYERGQTWMIEIVWPDGEHLRWGTDPDPMVLPVEVAMERLARLLMERYE